MKVKPAFVIYNHHSLKSITGQNLLCKRPILADLEKKESAQYIRCSEILKNVSFKKIEILNPLLKFHLLDIHPGLVVKKKKK